MKRAKTPGELRQEIAAAERLRDRPQEQIAAELKLNQATLSRITRGQFKRVSPAVRRVCEYAQISCITTRPLPELDASLAALAAIASRRGSADPRAIKLIRLAAELLEGSPARG